MRQESQKIPAFDAMLREASLLTAKKISEEFERETTDSFDGEHLFSGRFEKEMQEVIRLNQRRKKCGGVGRVLRRVAVVFLILFTGTFVTVFSVDALRVNLFHFIFDYQPDHIGITFEKSDDTFAGIDLDGAALPLYYPDYLPDGFFVDEANSQQNSLSAMTEFKNTNDPDAYFVLHQMLMENSAMSIDNGEYQKQTKVGEYEAILTARQDNIILVWHDNVQSFSLIGNISEEDAIKIAESLHIKSE